jgi:hypothetical protein
MALFSFGDIKFKTPSRSGFGATGALLSNPYQTSLLKYPSDLGATDKGHYLVIHVNEQKKSRFAMNSNTGDLPSVAQRRTYGISTTGSNAVNILNGSQNIANRLSGGAIDNFFNDITNKLSSLGISTNSGDYGVTATRESFSTDFLRTIQRTTDTIALYMPDTLAFNYNQSYSDITLGGDLTAAAIAGGTSIVDAINQNPGDIKGASTQALQNLSPFVLSVLGQSNKQLNAGIIAATQMVQNPMMELLYTSPAFRTFQFDFMFYPRDEQEATEVQRILDKLRFHQAPEIAENTNSFFLVPPSEFDIKFYYNGKENDNIPKISTCVLETITVDYAPNGFSAYEVQNEPYPSIGRTGMPVAIRLGLQFKETEYLTKQHYRGVVTKSALSTEDEIQTSADLGSDGFEEA